MEGDKRASLSYQNRFKKGSNSERVGEVPPSFCLQEECAQKTAVKSVLFKSYTFTGEYHSISPADINRAKTHPVVKAYLIKPLTASGLTCILEDFAAQPAW